MAYRIMEKKHVEINVKISRSYIRDGVSDGDSVHNKVIENVAQPIGDVLLINICYSESLTSPSNLFHYCERVIASPSF